MAGLTEGCCGPETQASCCAPEDKSACCEAEHAAGSCGCFADRPAEPDVQALDATGARARLPLGSQ
jgi:hypothetical protein